MATAAAAAKEFTTGPCVIEAVQKLLQAFPLVKLCEALGNAHAIDREALISALEKLADFDEVCSSFLGEAGVADFLRQGAASGDPRSTRLVARLLGRLASSDVGVGTLASAGLFAELERLLLDEELATAEAAARSLCNAVQWPAGREAVVGANGVVQHLQGRLQSLPDTQQIRVLSLFVELGRASETDVFLALEECGAFKQVLAAFLTDDILLKLNAVELVDALGSYKAGQELLSKRGVPEQFVADLSCFDDSVKVCVARLLGFVVLRDPAHMSTLLPDQQAPLAQALAAFLDSKDQTKRLCGLQAFGNITAHQTGLEFFLQFPDVLNEVISLAASPLNEICKSAMAVWANLLGQGPPKDAGPKQDIWKLAEQQVLPAVLRTLSNKPFPDVRECTWKLLAVFVCSQDAARKMLVSDEMRQKLLDFASETASPAKIAKHEFVRNLVDFQGSWLSAFLDENIEQMLSELAKQGPFWMPQVSKTEVATGGV